MKVSKNVYVDLCSIFDIPLSKDSNTIKEMYIALKEDPAVCLVLRSMCLRLTTV